MNHTAQTTVVTDHTKITLMYACAHTTIMIACEQTPILYDCAHTTITYDCAQTPILNDYAQPNLHYLCCNHTDNPFGNHRILKYLINKIWRLPTYCYYPFVVALDVE